jgi:predicted metalloprotease with PDZ domain
MEGSLRALMLGLAGALGLWAAPAIAAGEASPLPRLAEALPLSKARLGVEVLAMTPELREHLGAPSDRGVLVARVEPGSPAERAGMRVGDVVVAADGEPVSRPWDLIRRVGSVEAGSELALDVVRDGTPHALRATPEGPAAPWLDPERLGAWVGRGLRGGSEMLRERLDALERRLEELERRLGPTAPEEPGQAT